MILLSRKNTVNSFLEDKYRLYRNVLLFSHTHKHTNTHPDVDTTPSGLGGGSSGIRGLIDGSCLLVISTCQTSVTQSANTNQKHRYGAHVSLIGPRGCLPIHQKLKCSSIDLE